MLGVKDTRLINQIANMALVEWNDNVAISNAAPSEYWPTQVRSKTQLDASRLAIQLEHHALPPAWTELGFADFLTQRRKLIAAVIRKAFERLSQPGYAAVYPPAQPSEGIEPSRDRSESSASVRVSDLFDAGLLPAGTTLAPASDSVDAVAEIDEEGQIVLDDVPFANPSAAAKAATGTNVNGWTFWLADTPSGQRRLDAIRDEFRSADVEAASPGGE